MATSSGLIAILADGAFHSGESLAQALGISRTSVWKQIQKWDRELELGVQAVKGKGYFLPEPLDLLDEEALRQALMQDLLPSSLHLELHSVLASTNTHLMEAAAAGRKGPALCLAEQQTAGQGRYGRFWYSPFAKNLYLSLLWSTTLPPQRLSGLSLALGVAIAQCLASLGVGGVGLKWPNDLLAAGRKLGGLLIQIGGEIGGSGYLVAGLGLNVRMPAAATTAIDQPWIDLDSLGVRISRTQLAIALSQAMMECLHRLEQEGAEAYLREWPTLDVYRGQRVYIKQGERCLSGINRGIDASGALLLETEANLQCFHAGEVSLRGG